MTKGDLHDLAAAKYLLEYAFLVNRLKAVYSMILEWDMAVLPEHVRNVLPDLSALYVEKALSHVCRALSNNDCLASSVLEKSMTTNMNHCSGRTIPRFDVLNATMHVLLSSIEIAEFYGESLQSPETRLACMQVFALGGGSFNDQRPDSAYLSLRASLSDHFPRDPGESTAKTSMPDLKQILASCYSKTLGELFRAQSIPLIEAAGYDVLNNAFLEHFQDKAEGHFAYRRLERKYDPPTVEEAYRTIMV